MTTEIEAPNIVMGDLAYKVYLAAIKAVVGGDICLNNDERAQLFDTISVVLMRAARRKQEQEMMMLRRLEAKCQ